MLGVAWVWIKLVKRAMQCGCIWIDDAAAKELLVEVFVARGRRCQLGSSVKNLAVLK